MGTDLNNMNQVLLKPEFFAINALEATHEMLINDKIILKEVKTALLLNKVTKDYKILLKSSPREFGKFLQNQNYENGLLLYREKVYISYSVEDTLQQQIIKIYYNLLSARHPGWWKIYELVSRNYWWPGMTTFVKKYVTGCNMCQRIKNCIQQPFRLLVSNKVPNRSQEIISMDLITQLPESNGYDVICVIVDRLTKRAHFISINNRFSSKDIAQLLYDKVYPLHRLLLQIISDKEVQYSAKLFQEQCKILGIKSTISIVYHLQTDGQIEQVNQALEQYLWCYVDYNLSNWLDLLLSAEFVYNN